MLELSAEFAPKRIGRIDPSNSEAFIVPRVLLGRVATFCAETDAFMGTDEYRLLDAAHHSVRVNRYREDDNIVRSLVYAVGARKTNLRGPLQATSLIETPDNEYYGEWHWFRLPLDNESSPKNALGHPLRLIDWGVIDMTTQVLNWRQRHAEHYP